MGFVSLPQCFGYDSVVLPLRIKKKNSGTGFSGASYASPLEMRTGLAQGGAIFSLEISFPMKRADLQELLMGARTPIPPKTINTAAPDGAPPRRIQTVEKIFAIFHGLGVKPIGSCPFFQSGYQ